MRLENGALSPGEVVLRTARDLVEKPRTGRIIEEPWGQALGPGTEARAYGRGHARRNILRCNLGNSFKVAAQTGFEID